MDRSLAQNPETFRALFETAPDAMLVVGRDGKIVLANGNAGRLFGLRPEDLVGLPVEALMPERFRHAHLRHRQSYERAPRPRPISAGLTLFGRRMDGSEFPAEIALSPIQVAGERLYAASIRDISELARTHQAVRLKRSEWIDHREHRDRTEPG